MREPVLFALAVDGLMQAGYDLFLEIGAHPVLASYISECFATANKTATVVPSLRRKEPERAMMLGSVGKLYTLGYPIDWNRFYPQGGQLVRLPSYPWQRERYWSIGLLGILKAGGAYLPLDPTDSWERLQLMLVETKPSVLLSQQLLLERLPKHQAQVLCLDSSGEMIAQQSDENLTSNALAPFDEPERECVSPSEKGLTTYTILAC